MPRIAINMSEVPDKVPQIEPGMYVLRVSEAEDTVTKDEKGRKLVLKFTVDDESNRFHGMSIYEHLGYSNRFGEVRLKKLLQAAGIPLSPDGFNVEDLLNKHVKCLVKTRTYTADGGEIRESASIDAFVPV